MALSEKDELKFLNAFRVFEDEVVANSKSKGNWPESLEQSISDLEGEFVEFLDAFDKKVSFFGSKEKWAENVGQEAADLIQELIIVTKKCGIDLPLATIKKHKINLARPYGHKRNKVA